MKALELSLRVDLLGDQRIVSPAGERCILGEKARIGGARPIHERGAADDYVRRRAGSRQAREGMHEVHGAERLQLVLVTRIAGGMLQECQMNEHVNALALERLGDARGGGGLGEVDAVEARLLEIPRRREQIEEHETAAVFVFVQAPRQLAAEDAERAGDRDLEPAHLSRTTPARTV